MMRWTLEFEGGPRRVNHASVSIRDRYVFSFGGYCTGDDYSKLDKMDTHIFDSKNLQWIPLKTPNINDDDYASVPYMRYGHTASAIEDKVYIFGGRNDRNGACNNLFCFDTNTFRWSTPAVTGCIPPARDGHSACIIDRKIFIFGGYEQQSECFSKDVYVLDTTTMTWSHPRVTGQPASWRDFHTATAIGKYMYIFGGRGDMLGQFHSNQEIYDNQVVMFDTEMYHWHWIITNSISPIGRRSHSAVASGRVTYQDEFLLLEGLPISSKHNLLTRLIRLPPARWVTLFQNLQNSLFKPRTLHGQKGVLDVAYGRFIYIFGGYNGLEQKHYGDMYKFDTETRRWSKLNIPGNSPCPRRRHCCCLLGDKAVFFGGTSPAPGALVEDDYSLRDHSDLYILDLNPSLKTLSKLAVIKYKLNEELLPRCLQRELAIMVPKTLPQKPVLKSSQG